ncbi:hypothetical protein PV783_24970 [Chitinophaga sp. CC14]|uniref:hypothetical protein n=1 Tax=Chitinophaga sp. CC14 TaxID=3029199 RepID=UPI003B7AEC53
MEEIDSKIAQLKKVLEFKGYHGQVHINGIEQGSVEQVIKSCFAVKHSGKADEFKDPVVMTHFSFNKSRTQYMQAKFVIDLDQPERIKIKQVSFETCDLNHNILAVRIFKLSRNMDTPTIEKAWLLLSPDVASPKMNKGKSL